MKILVTGGAGFIGSNLVYKLAKNPNNKIVIIDNLSTGKLSNIEGLLNKRNIEFLEENICDNKIERFIRKNKFNYIYNFACPASPKYYLKFPIETWEANVLGVRNILRAIKDTNTIMLQASTSEVYGDAKQIPQKEEYNGNVNCVGVRACYDEGKRTAETLIFDYKRLYNVDARVVRIFNSYGPMMSANDGRIISNFINQAINNEDITIYGTGNQTRSFCYVDDTIDAIIKVMYKKTSYDFPINIGNPEEIEIKKVAILIKKLAKSDSKIVLCKPMQDDPCRRKPDISKAIKLLNWKPQINLEQGLKKCILYYKKERTYREYDSKKWRNIESRFHIN